MPLRGTTALVTGASRGIGRAIAQRFAADGANVVIGHLHDSENAAQTAALVAAEGSRGYAVDADISSPEAVSRLFAAALGEFGRLDVVVANAAVQIVDVAFGDVTDAEWDALFAVNAKGTFLTLQQAARCIRASGRIIVVSSNAVDLARPGFAAYGASKAAGRFLVEVLAKELGDRGITVNTVVPGVTNGAGLFADAPAEDPFLASIAQMTPLRRVGTPVDVAAAVAFLAGPDGAFVTGHHLRTDGGITI